MHFIKNIKTEYDLVVYAALILVVFVIALGMFVVAYRSNQEKASSRRFRFAATTFTSLIMLLVFAACLYYTGKEDSPGREIFDKGLLAIATLAGSIIGILFSSSRFANDLPDVPELNDRIAADTSAIRKKTVIAKEPHVAKEPSFSNEQPSEEKFGVIKEFGLVRERDPEEDATVTGTAGQAADDIHARGRSSTAKERPPAKERSAAKESAISPTRDNPRVVIKKRDTSSTM